MWHPHPWRTFRGFTAWTLRWAELPDGILGLTHHASKTVWLANGMTQAERRCTIAHETEHILNGPAPAGLARKEERQAREAAARKLLPSVHAIADALVWAQGDLVEAAEELWVDVGTLRDRLEFMRHPAERAYVASRCADHGLAVTAGDHLL